MKTFDIIAELGKSFSPLQLSSPPARSVAPSVAGGLAGGKSEEKPRSGVDALLYSLLDALLELMEAERGSVMFLDSERGELFIRVARGLKDEIVARARAKLEESLAGKAVLDLKPILIKERRVPTELKSLLVEPKLRASMVLPLRANGNAFGAVNLATQKKANVFYQEQRVKLATALVERLAPLIAEFLSFEAKEEELGQLRELLALSKELSAQREPKQGFGLICKLAQETLGVRGCVVVLMAGKETEKPTYSSIAFTQKLREGISAELDSGSAATCLKSLKCVLVEDLAKESAYRNQALCDAGIMSVASLPLLSGDSLLGVMMFLDSSPGGISEDSLSLAFSAASVASSFATSSLAYQELEQQTFSDSLTETASRGYFIRRLEEELLRSKRSQKPLSLVVVDIDDFKGYNDAFGHLVGDEVLAKVAELIKGQLRASDLVGRFGGDEFMVLLPEADLNSAAEVAERVRVAVANLGLTRLARKPLKLTVSLGVASAPGKTGNPAQLIHLADKAMYLSKRQGGNRVTTANDTDD